MKISNPIFHLLVVGAAIELFLFCWLWSIGQPAFSAFIGTPDTASYVAVALPLAETFRLVPGPRTVGYPVFMAIGYVVGGRENGSYVIILAQLILNILFTWGCWRLLERLVPAAGVRLRAVATAISFLAGLGMALYLMTDFLAALSFGMFLYGALFWRTPFLVLLSGTSLALATLTRPTFTFLPFLLPLISYLVARITSRIPWRHLVAYTAFSLGATGLSVAYQYTSSGYIGPSPAFTLPIQETLYHAIVKSQGSGIDFVTFQKQFEAEVESRAGRRFATLSPSDRERHAKQIFREEFVTHPREILTNYAKNVAKYLFVPIESTAMRVVIFYTSEESYFTYVRPVLGAICLPIWVLSLVPPVGPSRHRTYYFLVLAIVLYLVSLSAVGAAQGERYRFPVLAFMLPVFVWNVHRFHDYLHGSPVKSTSAAAASEITSETQPIFCVLRRSGDSASCSGRPS